MLKFRKDGKFARQYNQYEIKKDYIIGYTNKGEKFYVDKKDFDKIKSYCWRKDNNGYFITTKHHKDKNPTLILLHDLIMDWNKKDGLVVDHIHGHNSKYDNRRCNLRLVSSNINNINQPLRKDNKSGIKGVNWSNAHNKWIARISVNNKRIYLGGFDTFEEAKNARELAEEQYYGEYSYKNSINK